MVNIECDSVICRGQTVITTEEHLDFITSLNEVGSKYSNYLIRKEEFVKVKVLQDLNIDVIWRRLMDDMVEIANKMDTMYQM